MHDTDICSMWTKTGLRSRSFYDGFPRFSDKKQVINKYARPFIVTILQKHQGSTFGAKKGFNHFFPCFLIQVWREWRERTEQKEGNEGLIFYVLEYDGVVMRTTTGSPFFAVCVCQFSNDGTLKAMLRKSRYPRYARLYEGSAEKKTNIKGSETSLNLRTLPPLNNTHTHTAITYFKGI